jgi:anti-anti-sigma factor
MRVWIIGEVDLTTTPALADALELAYVAATEMPELIEIEVDLRAVEFLCAAGLTELIRTHHRCDRNALALHVVADKPAVTRPLRLTGLDQLLGLLATPDLRAPDGAVTRVSPSL